MHSTVGLVQPSDSMNESYNRIYSESGEKTESDEHNLNYNFLGMVYTLVIGLTFEF